MTQTISRGDAESGVMDKARGMDEGSCVGIGRGQMCGNRMNTDKNRRRRVQR